MKILVFDLSAPYGHFRVPYTVTSPLTLPVPSKTALYGILGAILGMDKSRYLSYFQNGNCKVAIGVKKPIRKVHIAENLINTKNVTLFARMNPRKKAPHTQIRYEFLKDAEYRIYVHMQDEGLLNRLEGLLKSHKSVYSISFGLSECLANYKFIGSYYANLIEHNKNAVDLSTILPIDYLSSSDSLSLIDADRKYIRFHMPLEMKPDREIAKTGDFIMEVNARTMKTKIDSYYAVEELNENIALF